jgi:hypothetical protein
MFLFFLAASSAWAAPPPLTVIPPSPKPGDAVTVTAAVGAAFDVRGASGVLIHPNKKSVVFIVPDAGSVMVVVTAGKVAAPQDVAVLTFGAGSIPTPGPTPTPTPDPVPTVAPIGGEGYKVLILYEAMQAQQLPAGQQSAIFGKAVRDYLNAKCSVGPDGATKEWRIWDKDVDASNESKVWQDALKRPRTAIPWLVVSDGKSGFEGPLPTTLPEIETILKKYGK